MDIITCGTCHAQYPLDEITFFIQHRAYECRPAANGVHESTYCDKGLTCSACGCHLRSAWALLQHVQEDHNLHLFIDRPCHEWQPRQLRPTDGPQRSVPAPIHSPQSPDAADGNRFCPQVLDYVGEPRSAVGEWIESCNTSPLTSSPPCFCRGARSGQTEAPNPDIVSDNNDDEENVPLDLHVDFAASNGSRSVSEGQWDSENSSPSVGEYTQQLHSDTLSSLSSAIIPKKRKWSSNEPTPSNEQISNVDQNTDINFVPRWKYSARLTELVPKLIEPADKRFAKQRNGTCGSSFSGSCGVQRSDPKNPQVPLNAEDKSNICRLGSDEESVVKGIPQLPALIEGLLDSNCDNHWHPPHQSSDNTVTHDSTGSSVEGSGQSFHGKKRRYPTTKPFKCELCDYSFNQRIHLKKHLSKHTGFKPFKCNLCDYSTVERSHLKVHIRIHTGEKPYRCTFCDYATAQNSTLKIHLKRHHGGKMFRCKTCSKTFTEATALHQHETVHTGRDAAYPEPAPHERDEAS